MPVGVLGLQGDFEAHRSILNSLGASCFIVKKNSELNGISGLIVPGGESTTLLKLLTDEFRADLISFVENGGALFTTCAGTILFARKVLNPDQESLAVFDIEVTRNAYGRQIDSFVTADLSYEDAYNETGMEKLTEAIFIRAPKITSVGEKCRTLVSYQGDPVLVQQGNTLASSFHPELAPADTSIHKYFLTLAGE